MRAGPPPRRRGGVKWEPMRRLDLTDHPTLASAPSHLRLVQPGERAGSENLQGQVAR